MESEYSRLSLSSNSDISDNEFYYVRQGDFTRFDTIDDDIEIITLEDVSSDYKSDYSGYYFQFDSVDDIVILEPKPEKSNLTNSTGDEIDVDRNIAPEFASKYDEVVREIKELNKSNQTKAGKKISPLAVLRKSFQTRPSSDVSKSTKRLSLLDKLKGERFSGIFRRKSKIFGRTSSVPRIVVLSPKSPGYDSGNDSDSSDDKEKICMQSLSSNQKLSVNLKKKVTRKSI